MTAQPPRGAVLLEALVGAVVFALAALAIVAFQARAAQALHHAHFRGEAQQLAHAVLARMHASDNATLYADFDMRAGIAELAVLFGLPSERAPLAAE